MHCRKKKEEVRQGYNFFTPLPGKVHENLKKKPLTFGMEISLKIYDERNPSGLSRNLESNKNLVFL
jgi:hypothetical protein